MELTDGLGTSSDSLVRGVRLLNGRSEYGSVK